RVSPRCGEWRTGCEFERPLDPTTADGLLLLPAFINQGDVPRGPGSSLPAVGGCEPSVAGARSRPRLRPAHRPRTPRSMRKCLPTARWDRLPRPICSVVTAAPPGAAAIATPALPCPTPATLGRQ